MMNQDQALDWLAELFQHPRGSLGAETPRGEIKAWDSLGVLLLMGDLDEKFGIVLADSEMQALKTVGDILMLLRERGQLTS
jgi:acyl carrier protein